MRCTVVPRSEETDVTPDGVVTEFSCQLMLTSVASTTLRPLALVNRPVAKPLETVMAPDTRSPNGAAPLPRTVMPERAPAGCTVKLTCAVSAEPRVYAAGAD